jgi:hypothetical protein
MGWLANPVRLAIHVVPPGLTKKVGRRSNLDRLAFQDDRASLPSRPCKPSKMTMQAYQVVHASHPRRHGRRSKVTCQTMQTNHAGDAGDSISLGDRDEQA